MDAEKNKYIFLAVEIKRKNLLPITNASVDAMAILRTMKNIATARHLPVQVVLRSLDIYGKPEPGMDPGSCFS